MNLLLKALYRRIEAHRSPPRWAQLLVLAECDWGDLWLPSLTWENWWDRPFEPRRPSHWPYLLASLVTGWIVMVEANGQ